MAKAVRTEYRFGEKIKKVRESQGITLKQLAHHMDVSASLLSQIENNKVSPLYRHPFKPGGYPGY